MRKLLGDFLIVLLCITLMVNFGRFFFLPDNSLDAYETIDVFSILDALSDIDVDPTSLYDAFSDTLSTVAGLSLRVTSVFQLKWSNGSEILSSILNILTVGFDLIYNAGIVLAKLAIVIYEFSLYFIDLFNALITFINKVFGAVFRLADVRAFGGFRGSTIGGDGFSGGGVGGRR